MNLLIFGTSITWGAWDNEGGWAQRLKGFCDDKTIESNFEKYISTYCLGIPGNNSNDLLERFENELKVRIDEEDNNVIIIEIGINDSVINLEENRSYLPPNNFKTNLDKLYKISQKYNTDIIFLGLTPVDDRAYPLPWAEDLAYKTEIINYYDNIIQEFSSENNIPYIELYSKFPEAQYVNLLSDGVHPTSKGHQIIFDTVKEYLISENII